MGGCCSKRKRRNDGDDEDHELCKKQERGSFEDLGEMTIYHDCYEKNEEESGARVARVRLKGSSSFSSMFSQQGWKGVNQDAMTIWEDFGDASGNIFCGIFDGHGTYGHRVACYVRDHLPSKLSSRSSSLQGDNVDKECNGNSHVDHESEFSLWKSSCMKAFEEVDKELRNHATIDCICSGSTAVTIVKQREHLMIANLGDSRAILCSRDDNNHLVEDQLTVDLKPNLPSEAERIRICGGRVFALDEEPDVHRMWLPDEDRPGLAMARAFGDFCLKDYGLISTPQVSSRKLEERDEFVVLATDGVWDVLPSKEVMKIISSTPKRCDAAKTVVQQAIKSWRSKFPSSKVDDCAVICLFLKPPPLLSSKSSLLKTSISRESSFTDSFKTAKSEEQEEDWNALGGVSRSNSLMKLPRFGGVVSVLSWRKKSLKVLEENV